MQRTAHPDKAEWNRFYESIRQLSGLDLWLYKPEQLRKRIMDLVKLENLKTVDALLERVTCDPHGFKWFMERLALNVSEFYRDAGKWQELRSRVLPGLVRENPRLKCWSAGCSFGAEAHTLAIVLDVHFPGPHSILCTDLDKSALDLAWAGEFTEHDMRKVPPEVRKAYFDWNPILECWTAKRELSHYMRFQEQNLLLDTFEDGFDLILCRNVMIYLTDAAQRDLLRKFFAALRPGGILFTGSTERVHNSLDFEFENTLPCFYRKPVTANVLLAA